MGNFVSFSIDVKNDEVELPFVAGKEQAWLDTQSIDQWAPAQSNPSVDLHLEVNADGSYKPVSSWNGGQVRKIKTQSSVHVDTAAMDRLREN